MRNFLVVAAVAALTFGAVGSAEAKPKGDSAAAAPAGTAAEAYSMDLTGLAKIDDFFATAKAPLDTIVSVRTSIDNVSTQLNTALGLAAGTPFKDALADLKTKANDKITVAMNGDMPKLTTADAVPANVAQAIEAVNTGITSISAAMKGLEAIPGQLSAIIDQSKQFSDPNTLKQIIADAGANPTLIAKVPGKLKNNVNTLSKAKDEPAALKASFGGLVTDVTSTFSK